MNASPSPADSIHERPAELLQKLIRFDTTNPPGNEADCIAYIESLLKAAGIDSVRAGRVPERPNLVARIKGKGAAPPLLLYGHVDVVTTAGQDWTHPPFEGRIVDGHVWGRGALDMKGGVAMMLSAFLRANASGLEPAGDVIFAALSDEEAGAEFGAAYLAENHADLFDGVRFAVGEFGGFPMYFGGKKFYTVQVAEKQISWFKALIRGPGGHGSLPMSGGAAAELGRVLQALDSERLPWHVTPVVRQMLEIMAAEAPDPHSAALSRLLDPATIDSALEELGPQKLMFEAMLRNTVNANIFRGGDKINVIPSEIEVELDGRLLPGFKPDDLKAELRAVIGDGVELNLMRHDPAPPEADMGLFDTLAGILDEADPGGTTVPLLMMGSTDARFLSRNGIQTYGFLPMNLAEDFEFIRIVHAADERIPVEAVTFGTDAVYKVLQRFGEAQPA